MPDSAAYETSAGRSVLDIRSATALLDADVNSAPARISQDGSVLKFADYSTESDDTTEESTTGLVTSTFVRRIEANGDQILEVRATAVFAVGARQTMLHIPFTPSFRAAPSIDCEVADGSDVQLKVGQIFPYGVRLELKRNGPDLEELAVSVDLFAVHAVSRCAT